MRGERRRKGVARVCLIHLHIVRDVMFEIATLWCAFFVAALPLGGARGGRLALLSPKRAAQSARPLTARGREGKDERGGLWCGGRVWPVWTDALVRWKGGALWLALWWCFVEAVFSCGWSCSCSGRSSRGGGKERMRRKREENK